jgi:hypothetical protein
MASQNVTWTSKLRRSPVYRALGFLPTPARPWIMAFEAISALQLRKVESTHLRKEASLERQLNRAMRARGGGLRAMVIGAGLTWAARKLMASKPVQARKLRVSGFMTDALDRVQAAADDGFGRVRQTVGAKKDQE